MSCLEGTWSYVSTSGVKGSSCESEMELRARAIRATRSMHNGGSRLRIQRGWLLDSALRELVCSPLVGS